MIKAMNLSIDQLQSLPPNEATPIEIRGFLYKTENGDLYLSSEPNLKSCCVGSAHKRSTQIKVVGDNLIAEPSMGFSSHLKGNIIANIDREGTTTYLLVDATSVEHSLPITTLAPFALCVIMLAAVIFGWIRRLAPRQ